MAAAGSMAGGGARPYVTDTIQKYRYTLIHAGWLCVIAALALSTISVYTIDVGLRPDAAEGGLAPRASSQLVFIAIGIFSGAAAVLPHYRLIGFLAWPAMALSVGLLVFLLLPGVPDSIVRPVNGARAWIQLGFFNLQPSELTKIAFVLVVAQYLRFRRTHRTFMGLLPIAGIAFVPLALILKQPDMGTALLFIPTLFALLVAAGARIRHLVIIVLVAALAAPAVYPVLKPYQKARIKAVISQIRGEREGAHGINYQSLTAQSLAGSGQLTGSSDAHTRALARFNPLPERHNDMIFSIVVARFGFLGGLGVLALYMLWISGALLAAAACKDPFGRLLCVGLMAFIGTQVVVNVGMNVGLLPIIGITLPFLSHGGSSMITVWIMTGLIVNVAIRKPVPPFRESFEYGDDE
ncbi:MAG: FtsW/RodA/SpoVE family cell cycle protein [Phycisphaeraceae bacterium]|nr:FtsW/RodA/SpoVE family cell cycle protein [Phycisphaeraceae bacterium]